APDRARRRPRSAGMRPDRGARLRPHDRRGHAGRDPRQPRGDRGIPRRGLHHRGSGAGPERAGDGRGVVVNQRDGSLLECRSLAAGYGALAVVRDVDLRVDPGEVVALIGPNGAGKTTTLLTIAGELPAMSGQVVFRGAPTKAPLFRRARRGMGFVTE